jgi:CRISPR system Cascade subunit CasC
LAARNLANINIMEVKMFVELHMIQSFAPSNLNRDDAGNPKECEFGGYRRARISSQCLKRAIRWDPLFTRTVNAPYGKGDRTKLLADKLVKPALVQAGKQETDALSVAARFTKAYAQSIEQDGVTTSILVYISPEEVQEIVQSLLDQWDAVLPDTKDANNTLSKLAKQSLEKYEKITSAPDIALFGRMLAIKPSAKVLDAACQVAHAISTHAVSMEMDFFTAVDDISGESGAGMMGYIGFNSACFYRYARIDWQQLVANLQKDHALARRTVEGFLRAAVRAVPSGMQNSHAALNPPDFLLGVVRNDGMGWSLANAFERPVRPRGDNGLVAPSVQALDAYWGRLCQVYGTDTLTRVAALTLDPDLSLENLKGEQVENLEKWISAVTEALPVEEA